VPKNTAFIAHIVTKFPLAQQSFVEIYIEFYPNHEEECRKCERRFQTAFRNTVFTAATIQIRQVTQRH